MSHSGLGTRVKWYIQVPCSQRPRLHKLTSIDLGLRTLEPMWSGKIPTSVLSMTEIARIDLKWLGTWDFKPVWNAKSHLQCSQRLRLHILTSTDLGLKTWDPCEVVKSQLLCCQRLRLHGLTSSDLELRTPCEMLNPNFHALNDRDCTD